MLAFVCGYLVAALIVLVGLLKQPALGAALTSPMDDLGRIASERIKASGWLPLLNDRAGALLMAGSSAIAWPYTTYVLLRLARYSDTRERYREMAVLRLCAADLLVQPACVLVVFAMAIALWDRSEPRGIANQLVGAILVLYTTLFQARLMLESAGGGGLRRSSWTPAVVAIVTALLQGVMLILGYAALKDAGSLSSRALESAQALVDQHKIASRLLSATESEAWSLGAALSGVLLVTSILRSSMKFWAHKRLDGDWIDIASSQLFAQRFADALRSLEQVKDRGSSSALNRATAALAVGRTDDAITYAGQFWAQYLDRPMSADQAATRLLGATSMFLIPWAAVESLIAHCLRVAPLEPGTYSAVESVAQANGAPVSRIEAMLRDHFHDTNDHPALLANFLFCRGQFKHAEEIAIGAKPAGFMATAVTMHILIMTPACLRLGTVSEFSALFEERCRQHLKQFETAARQSMIADDLKSLLTISHEMAYTAKRLGVASRFALAAVHAEVEERFRQVASASEFDSYALIRRSMEERITQAKSDSRA